MWFLKNLAKDGSRDLKQMVVDDVIGCGRSRCGSNGCGGVGRYRHRLHHLRHLLHGFPVWEAEASGVKIKLASIAMALPKTPRWKMLDTGRWTLNAIDCTAY